MDKKSIKKMGMIAVVPLFIVIFVGQCIEEQSNDMIRETLGKHQGFETFKEEVYGEKTYSNTQYGFEFKYPPSYIDSTAEYKKRNPIHTLFLVTERRDRMIAIAAMDSTLCKKELIAYPSEIFENLKESADKNTESEHTEGEKYSKIIYTFDGNRKIKAIKVVTERFNNSPTEVHAVYFLHSDILYSLSINLPDTLCRFRPEYPDKILSGFRLKDTQTVITDTVW